MSFDSQLAIVSTGSINAGVTATVTVNWLASLPASNTYIVSASVQDPSGFLVVQNFDYQPNGLGITVKVKNTDSSSHAGYVHASGTPVPGPLTTRSELDDLTVRLNAIDGQNLPDPSLAILTVLANANNGNKTTLGAAVLKIEQLFQGLSNQVAKLQSTLNTHLGI